MGPAVQARAFDSIAKAFAENPGLQQGAIPELVYLAKQNPAFAPSAAANMLPKQDKPPSAVDLIDRQAAPAQRSQDVEVPEELRVEARARIQKAGHLSTVEKARAMDKLNRHGKLDTSVLGGLAQPAAAPDAAPVARKPSGSTNQDMKDAVDFVRQKRREDF